MVDAGRINQMRWLWASLALLALIVVLIVIGLRYSGGTYPGFFPAFVPNLWANIIGVSIAAVIGVPFGLAVNRLLSDLAEKRTWRRRAGEVRDLLQQVQCEVRLHSGNLQQLLQLFPATLPPTSSPAQGGQTITRAPQIATLLLQDISGRRALSDRILFEVNESLACFELSNYYARVSDLNRLLNFSIQYAGAWDWAIAGLVQTTWIAQQQIGLPIEQAVSRLDKQATQ